MRSLAFPLAQCAPRLLSKCQCEVSQLTPLKESWSSELPISKRQNANKYFDSSLVNPYENVIPFYCFSVNHQRKALCNLPYLTLSSRHFKTASRGELSRRSETVVSALRWLWFVHCITTESAAENQFYQALFVLCRGSTLSKSTYFPDRGTNSCLNLFWAINF